MKSYSTRDVKSMHIVEARMYCLRCKITRVLFLGGWWLQTMSNFIQSQSAIVVETFRPLTHLTMITPAFRPRA